MKKFSFWWGAIALPVALGVSGVTFAQVAPGRSAPNDTGVNVRDRNENAVTADQQSNAKGDAEITRQIRRALEKDSSLSTMAHNIKIISDNGVVTLRGPVKSAEEEAAVRDKAKTIAGAANVHDQLEVEARQ